MRTANRQQFHSHRTGAAPHSQIFALLSLTNIQSKSTALKACLGLGILSPKAAAISVTTG
jgi:hypothetical protein